MGSLIVSKRAKDKWEVLCNYLTNRKYPKEQD